MSLHNNPVPIIFIIIPILVAAGFLYVFCLLIFNIVRGIIRWSNNNSQPILTTNVKVVTKRTNVSGGGHNVNGNFSNHRTSTTYYVTFEMENGDRMEFKIKGKEYGLLAENDYGKLTYQGTRFLGFQREIDNDKVV